MWCARDAELLRSVAAEGLLPQLPPLPPLAGDGGASPLVSEVYMTRAPSVGAATEEVMSAMQGSAIATQATQAPLVHSGRPDGGAVLGAAAAAAKAAGEQRVALLLCGLDDGGKAWCAAARQTEKATGVAFDVHVERFEL